MNLAWQETCLPSEVCCAGAQEGATASAATAMGAEADTR